MRAYQIMTKDCITVTPHTTIGEAAKIMLQTHISGLPVMNDAGKLVGIISESDFLRRSEIGTGRKNPSPYELSRRSAARFRSTIRREVSSAIAPDCTN
jgi:CBS-domain-containing membrane protein